MKNYTFRGMTVPARIIEIIDRYVEHGNHPGSFLEAVIENDLNGAINRADDEIITIIPGIVGYLANKCPIGCWGADGAVSRWIERKTEVEK